MKAIRTTLLLGLVFVSGCSSYSYLHVSGMAPLADWVAKKAVPIHQRLSCQGEVLSEERSARTSTRNSIAEVSVDHTCTRGL